MDTEMSNWPEPTVCDQAEDMLGCAARAIFNEARTHRYFLERHWATGSVMTWIMLNPSTADAFADDPTVQRCIKFARRENFGGIQVLNLYALRSPDPAALRAAADPVGACNDQALNQWARGTVVAAWGSHPFASERARDVTDRLLEADVHMLRLGITRDGSPIHPLARGRARVSDDAPLTPWRPTTSDPGRGEAA